CDRRSTRSPRSRVLRRGFPFDCSTRRGLPASGTKVLYGWCHVNGFLICVASAHRRIREREGGGRSERALRWTGHRYRCLPFAHTPDSASSAAGYDPRTRTIWLSVRRASSASCVRGSFASASRSTQKTYSQRAVREGRDSSFERLRPCSAKAPRLRCSEPGTFRTAKTRVVFIAVRLRSLVANAPIHSGANGSRARTANRVRLSCPVWMSPARTSSPYMAATRGDATAAAPRSACSAIIRAAPAVL